MTAPARAAPADDAPADDGSGYATPTITLSAVRLGGAVGAVDDPTVTADVTQAGVPDGFLRLRVVASSDPAVADVADVRQTRTPDGDRELSVRARGRGYTDLTVEVTGRGGETATTTLSYAASARVADSLGTRYLTGSSDASAAVDVGGGHALVADDESHVLRLYDRSRSGGPVRTWDLGPALGSGKEADIEAATRVGDTIYWTGSLGNDKDGTYKADRDTVLTTRVTGSGAATEITFGAAHQGLREDLIAWDTAHGDRYGFAAGTAAGQVPRRVDGFDVEGLEFAPGSTTTAYVGFRAPLAPAVPGGKALLVPVTNLDEVLAAGEEPVFGEPIEMDLGGLAVRDIKKNARNHYLILAGSCAADDDSDPYALYQWDGVPGHAPRKRADLPTTDPGAWESIVAVPDLRGRGARVQLITDNGASDLYGDGVEAKDLAHPEWKKSRSAWFTLR
ncbi:DUF3616 domain-containing protein [Streptomyces sp. RerS4]|uniref:DUF3616 domain-containing protein n=1 Tax=Streptomyces sp. RerS4 TaxID=2942449 RepID=UPI00201BDB24|nr:DUF3616 domain-containing protein [Streptomyces sp. RerS4]UQX04911.1 DUF3616 domain-containing protein [Streptomyces sp. RerS4]